MPTRRQLIQKITLNSTSSSISFTNIPQIYNDLVILSSVRTSRALEIDIIRAEFNGSTSTYLTRSIEGAGSSVAGSSLISEFWAAAACGANNTTSTFSNSECYIPNYTRNTQKNGTTSGVSENNASTTYCFLSCSSWSGTSPITSISLTSRVGATIQPGSTFYLYGITHVPIIRGGEVTVPGDGFKYHTFRSSGSLQVIEPGDVECLAVAGGGGGGWSRAGGGGAGGLSYFKTRVSNGTQTVTIGAGGPGSIGGGAIGSNGQQTTVGSIISTSGGGGGGNSNSGNGSSGGSGGGGAENGIGGTGVSGQGNSGGSGAGNGGGGGGGGAASSGTNGTSTTPGPGGAGRQIFGAFYAGGGGGGVDAIKGTAGASGGIGGGASGSNSTVVPNNATPNTGGGGGGGGRTSSPSAEGSGSNGGSGIVIIRYPYDGN